MVDPLDGMKQSELALLGKFLESTEKYCILQYNHLEAV